LCHFVRRLANLVIVDGGRRVGVSFESPDGGRKAVRHSGYLGNEHGFHRSGVSKANEKLPRAVCGASLVGDRDRAVELEAR
jgi:hypothetical protein